MNTSDRDPYMGDASAPELPAKRGPGRPRGQQFDAVLGVRLPRPALDAIRELATRANKSVAEVIRTGLIASLVHAVGPAAAIAKDPNALPSKRMEAMDLLRLVVVAHAFLGPTGLKIARAEARRA